MTDLLSPPHLNDLRFRLPKFSAVPLDVGWLLYIQQGREPVPLLCVSSDEALIAFLQNAWKITEEEYSKMLKNYEGWSKKVHHSRPTFQAFNIDDIDLDMEI